MIALRRRPPALSRVLTRLGVLGLMGTSVAFDLWPVASLLLAGLAVCEGSRWLGLPDPLANLAQRGFRGLDESAQGRRWIAALDESRRLAQTRDPGMRAMLRRTWRRLSGTSAAIARAVPFVLLGTVGSVMGGQVGLATLLVAAYPFLEVARYHEALRRIRQNA